MEDHSNTFSSQAREGASNLSLRSFGGANINFNKIKKSL